MPDPQLTLFGAGGTTVASNDNGSGNGAATFVANAVGAFAVTDGQSRDAMLVLTLPPSDYSARVAGASGTGGQVIIEVYEVAEGLVSPP
ncbi:MAG TPA: hypothetical protein VM029_10825 [Opitutaceae bacterium]|nr:hypothetical protein [Opitutaceae bacterium]